MPGSWAVGSTTRPASTGPCSSPMSRCCSFFRSSCLPRAGEPPVREPSSDRALRLHVPWIAERVCPGTVAEHRLDRLQDLALARRGRAAVPGVVPQARGIALYDRQRLAHGPFVETVAAVDRHLRRPRLVTRRRRFMLGYVDQESNSPG